MSWGTGLDWLKGAGSAGLRQGESAALALQSECGKVLATGESAMKFMAEIRMHGDLNATGIVVPDEVAAALGGRRLAVVVTLNGYTYRSTTMPMAGEIMVPLAQEHRARAGITGAGRVEVDLSLDTAPREVIVPEDLAQALRAAGAEESFSKLAFTHRKEHVRAIDEAKTQDTRSRRIAKAVAMVLSK
jgi:Bacteriocin-protection, YdeI or OmpD-Associated/Domain of unknown function (DUF1905)